MVQKSKGAKKPKWNILVNLYIVINVFSFLDLFFKDEIFKMECIYPLLYGFKASRDTIFSSLVAMWVAEIAIIIFIIGKSQDVVYGIKYVNIFFWEISILPIVFSGICYVLLLPAGLWAYIRSNISGIIWILILTYGWICGTGLFIVTYLRKANFHRMIQRVSEQFIRAPQFIFRGGYINIENVNKLPLMSMIRNMEFDNLDETQVVKRCIWGIFDVLKEKKDISMQYLILVPIISAICENSGYSNRYEIGRTVEFCAELLEKDGNLELNFWIQAGIILPMIEQTDKNESGKNIVTILKRFPWKERRELVIVSLLYIDYLRSCGDDNEQRIKVLMQIDPASFVREYRIDKYKRKQLYTIWISWHLLNNQETFQIFALEHFINGCMQWNKEDRVLESYVLKKLEWEELKR